MAVGRFFSLQKIFCHSGGVNSIKTNLQTCNLWTGQYVIYNSQKSLVEIMLQGVPHLRDFHYCGSHYRIFWIMYAQVGDFCVSRGSLTVTLTRISRNAVFFKSQNPGTLCKLDLVHVTLQIFQLIL